MAAVCAHRHSHSSLRGRARRIRRRGDVRRCVRCRDVIPVRRPGSQTGVGVRGRRGRGDLTEWTRRGGRTPDLIAGYTDIVGRCSPREVDLAPAAIAVAGWC